MINHARTLLLNRSGIAGWDGDAGMEYIAPAFGAITIPA